MIPHNCHVVYLFIKPISHRMLIPQNCNTRPGLYSRIDPGIWDLETLPGSVSKHTLCEQKAETMPKGVCRSDDAWVVALTWLSRDSLNS